MKSFEIFSVHDGKPYKVLKRTHRTDLASGVKKGTHAHKQKHFLA